MNCCILMKHKKISICLQPPAGVEGFIVELKSDSGYGVLSKCQQIVINKRGVLQNEDASMVFGTTFCVPLSTTYSIRVRAYPVPMGTEKDKDIFTKAMFTSRTCEEVYGAHHCKGCLQLGLYAENECYKNWAPTNITIFGSDNTVSIEFDSAPDEYNIRYYLVYYRGFEEESWRMKMVPHKKSRGNSRLKDVLENFKPGINYTFMVSSDLTDSPSKEVYYVFPETESVPKVVFIVAPLLVMVTGVALGFTIVFVSSAKKKVAGGLNKGEESFGSCLRDPQCQTKPLRFAPHVFLCYSSCEGPAHTHLVLAFAHYLQQHCSCQVTLDLWEELVIAREGHVSWMSSHIESCDFVIIICSKTLKNLVDTKSSVEVDFRNSFVASVSLVGEILGQALIFKRDISKFIVVSFQEDIHLQIPNVLQLATKYKLMEDFPKLFSHLHSLELLQPGLLLHVSNINQDDYFMVNSGYLLYCAIKKSYLS
ncbi:interleukin-17 receptor D-like [Polypterus senegalus]|uniref:interleukin-17 receptor D-like n=1 Tax=Polypterus senegalus TaxID=55291 RepID=UPI0019658180|nr:interleukin-17 receptor D-like [Polypterus senegalus]